jgi:hypothetical protein
MKKILTSCISNRVKKFLFTSFLLLSLFTLGGIEGAFAGTDDNIDGYAWSSNVGWISFNCTNDNSCATADYGVNKNGDGTLVGYAWSSSVGWIQFGGLSGFPSGSGTTASNAVVSGSNLVGWARVISQDGIGWDGWVSLSGTVPTYGVSFSGTTFTGYAWGSDVIGWLLFDVQNVYPAVCGDCGVTLSGDATLDVTSGGSIVGNYNVPYNTAPTMVWTLTNIPGATCSVSKAASSTGATPFTTVSGITSSGSTTGSSHTTGLYTYNIDCTNPTISKQVGFGIVAEPPGFSLGGTETANIQFLASTTADSEQKTFFVSAFGGFTDNVSVDVTGGTCPASTKYSLGGGAFAVNPSPVSVAYNGGSTFKARIPQKITSSCTVTITGTAPGLSVPKNYILTPTVFTPVFEEY